MISNWFFFFFEMLNNSYVFFPIIFIDHCCFKGEICQRSVLYLILSKVCQKAVKYLTDEKYLPKTKRAQMNLYPWKLCLYQWGGNTGVSRDHRNIFFNWCYWSCWKSVEKVVGISQLISCFCFVRFVTSVWLEVGWTPGVWTPYTLLCSVKVI